MIKDIFNQGNRPLAALAGVITLAGALAVPSIVRGIRGSGDQPSALVEAPERQRSGDSVQATVQDIGGVTLGALEGGAYSVTTEQDDPNAYEGMQPRVEILAAAKKSGNELETSSAHVTAYFDKNTTGETPSVEDAKEVIVTVRKWDDGELTGYNLSMHRAGTKGWVAESTIWKDNPWQPEMTRVVERADGTSTKDELDKAADIADEAWNVVATKFPEN